MGAVAELEHDGDEVDGRRREQLPDMMMRGILDAAVDETEIERRSQQDDEGEDDLLQVHDLAPD